MLAPGGRLVLSTPNVARLHSRWHFLFTGTHKLIRRRVGWDLAPDDLYAYHINPVDFPLLHTLLRQAGLAIERLDFTRFKWKHAWLLLLYPFVWLSTRIETRRHRGGDAHARGRRGSLPLDDAPRDARERAAAADRAEGSGVGGSAAAP